MEASSTESFQEPSCHRNPTWQHSLPWSWAWREVAAGQPVSVCVAKGRRGAEAPGSAPQTRLLPHTCSRKTDRETGPQVEEGQGPAVRTLQFHEKTRLNLFGVSRANATDLPVFRNGRDVTPGASCSPPNLHRPRKGVNSRLRNVLISVMDRDRAQLPAGSQGTLPQPGSGTTSLGLSPS